MTTEDWELLSWRKKFPLGSPLLRGNSGPIRGLELTAPVTGVHGSQFGVTSSLCGRLLPLGKRTPKGGDLSSPLVNSGRATPRGASPGSALVPAAPGQTLGPIPGTPWERTRGAPRPGYRRLAIGNSAKAVRARAKRPAEMEGRGPKKGMGVVQWQTRLPRKPRARPLPRWTLTRGRFRPSATLRS